MLTMTVAERRHRFSPADGAGRTGAACAGQNAAGRPAIGRNIFLMSVGLHLRRLTSILRLSLLVLHSIDGLAKLRRSAAEVSMWRGNDLRGLMRFLHLLTMQC